MVDTSGERWWEERDEREALGAALASEEFRGTTVACKLLSTLCEARWTDSGEPLSQQNLGELLYGSDDEEELVKVRKAVGALRARLLQYYSRSGSSSRLRMAVPMSDYRVEFTAAPRDSPDPTLAHTASASAGARPSLWRYPGT